MLEFEVYQKKKIPSGKYQVGRRECKNSVHLEKKRPVCVDLPHNIRKCESNRRMIVKKVHVDLVLNEPVPIHSA